jgi:hypothetical protein
MARKKRKVETNPRAVFPQDLRAISLIDKHITKCSYGQDYKYNTSLRVIGAALRMQKGYLHRVQCAGKEKAKHIEKPQIRDTVCNLFHIGHDAYSDIVGGYLHNQKVYQSGKTGGGGEELAILLQRRRGSPGQRRCRSRCEILFEAGE